MEVVDLFSGPGGWDVAARRLGLDPLGIEFDDAACATRNAAGLRTLQADVAALEPMREFEGGGIIASPPCQAFSMAGQGHGRRALSAYEEAIERWLEGKPPSREELDEACEDERGHLVLEPLRWMLALKPMWLLCEQVEPVLPLWQAMARGLSRAGYSTWSGVVSAEQYGVPQTRKRAVLIVRKGGKRARRPPATHQRYLPPARKFDEETSESLFDSAPSGRRVAPEDHGLLPWLSMADALGWGMTKRPGMTLAFGTKAGGASLDGGGSGARAILNAERESGRWIVDRPATTVVGEPRIFQPGGHHAPGKQSQNAIRVSVEEAAMLQSFASDYPFQGTRTKVFEQIGNAIPPLLAEAILREIMP